MIHIFRGAIGFGIHPAFDAMHRDRKRVFVDLLRWDVPVIEGCFEADQFDGESAVYLVSADADGAHRGSIRLLPTEGDHLLAAIFPQLCEGPVPCGPDIFEISRGCLSPRLPAPERLAVRNELTTAAVNYALGKGITAFTCVADSGWFKQVMALGWEYQRLGRLMKIEGVQTGALKINVRADTLDSLRKAGTYASAPFQFERFPASIAA